eukprot:CAMPEP_0196575446 /NCGR_PEP_ID=MMETSP1081-20130531/4922_1 /TAXON_ID=36882 /ORGANISM="Pyramimonas amylifera, Strain CCMP720" /LENGTH=184 /DNA_ID=CAMNT_0041893751 /DNA_START=104 /DNA_END=658 /DNA_ORIENTATION=+
MTLSPEGSQEQAPPLNTTQANISAAMSTSIDLVHCILIASRVGANVLFDRFYTPRGEAVEESERVGWWEALHRASERDLGKSPEDVPNVATHLSRHIVWMCSGETVIYLVGTGIYDEITLAEAAATLVAVIKLICKTKSVTIALVLANLGKVCLAVDQMIFAGEIERMNVESIYKSIKLKQASK